MFVEYIFIFVCVQSALGHGQNNKVSFGHVKQTDADNMYSYCTMIDKNNFTQVSGLSVFSVLFLFVVLRACKHRVELTS